MNLLILLRHKHIGEICRCFRKTSIIILLLSSNAYAGVGLNKTTQTTQFIGTSSWDDPQRAHSEIVRHLEDISHRRKLIKDINDIKNDPTLTKMLLTTPMTEEGTQLLERQMMAVLSSPVDKTGQFVVDKIKNLNARLRIVKIVNEYKQDPVLTDMLKSRFVSEETVSELEAQMDKVLTGAMVVSSSQVIN